MWVILRRFGDVLLTLIPLLVAGVVTLEISVLVGLRLNFANILAIPLLLGAMLWALRTDNRGALWLAYAGFAVEVFSLYIKTFGTLLDTSLFFLIAAVMVSGLAWAAYKLHQRKTPEVAA